MKVRKLCRSVCDFSSLQRASRAARPAVREFHLQGEAGARKGTAESRRRGTGHRLGQHDASRDGACRNPIRRPQDSGKRERLFEQEFPDGFIRDTNIGIGRRMRLNDHQPSTVLIKYWPRGWDFKKVICPGVKSINPASGGPNARSPLTVWLIK